MWTEAPQSPEPSGRNTQASRQGQDDGGLGAQRAHLQSWGSQVRPQTARKDEALTRWAGESHPRQKEQHKEAEREASAQSEGISGAGAEGSGLGLHGMDG